LPDGAAVSFALTIMIKGSPHTPNSNVHVPEQSNHQKLLATDVLVVDWDGPNDPLNPKKCVALPE